MAQSFFQAPSGPHKPAPVKGYTIRGTGKGNWQYVGGKGAKAPKVPAPKPPKANAAANAAKANVAGQYGSALYDPTQILTGKNLANAASSIADAQTKGPLAELASQIAANNKSSAGVQQQDFGYYKSLAQAAQDAVNQQAQVSQGLQGQLQGIGSQAQQQLAAQGQQALGGVNARMQALGLGGDTTANIGAQTAQQQQTGAQNAQTFQAAGANQSAANESQALSQLGNTGLQGQEKIAAVAQANAKNNLPLTAKIADEQASKGALTATALGQLRTAERNYQISEQGLGVKQQTAATTAANDAAKIQTTQRGQNLTAKSKALALSEKTANDQASQLSKAAALAEKTKNDSASQAYKEAALAAKQAAQNAASGKGGGAKPISAVSQVRLYGQITHIEGLIQQAQSGGVKNANKIRGLLKAKYSYPDAFIEAAFDLLGYGALTPQTANALKNMGLRGGTFRGAPIKVKSQQRGIGSVVAGAAPAGSPGGVLGGIIGNL